MPDHTFTEEEVRAVIRRAVARQEEAEERREAREHGLTLAELEQLGAEVGLAPEHLRTAAEEVRTGRPVAAEATTQTDTHVIVERWVDGPWSVEAWEDTVALLRRWVGSGKGKLSRVGRAHEWSHTSDFDVETRVSASERRGRTRLLLSQRVGQARPEVEGIAFGGAAGLVAGVLGAVMLGDAIETVWLFLAVLFALAVSTALVLSPIITRLDRRWREKKHRRLQALAADVEAVFEAAQPEVLEARPAESALAGRLDLDALDPVPAEAEGRGAPVNHRTRL